MFDVYTHLDCNGQDQSAALHLSPVHLGVMTSVNVFTRIVDMAAKDVVLLDLFWFEELHSLVLLFGMDEARF